MKKINLLPGPVKIQPVVAKEFNQKPISHRCDKFIGDFKITQKMMCSYVNAKSVEFLAGSGTIANEAIAAQLYSLKEKGIIFVLGEFSNRLVEIAKRHNLDFDIVEKPWGDILTKEDVEKNLYANGKKYSWMWTVHCETSTGVLNDLNMLKECAKKGNVKLCVDCISSISTIPIDLSDVYLASGTSGKAIGSYPGIAMVFYNHRISPSTNIPMYLDIGYYNKKNGIPFTISSNLIYALKKAIENLNKDSKFEIIKNTSDYLRNMLCSMNIELLISKENSSPAVITFLPPKNMNSKTFGDFMDKCGYILSYNSSYLLKRNWIQIFIMRNTSIEDIKKIKNILKSLY